jgi:hypothetical protein
VRSDIPQSWNIYTFSVQFDRIGLAPAQIRRIRWVSFPIRPVNSPGQLENHFRYDVLWFSVTHTTSRVILVGCPVFHRVGDCWVRQFPRSRGDFDSRFIDCSISRILIRISCDIFMISRPNLGTNPKVLVIMSDRQLAEKM